jgi:amidase
VEEGRPACFARTYDLLGGLFGADGGASAHILRKMAGTAVEDLSPFLQFGFEIFKQSAISTPEFFALWAEADSYRADSLAFMQKYDVIVSPAVACLATPHGGFGEKYNAISYTQMYNLLGWPAAVVRAGTSSEGLPIGVQIASGPWREDLVLAVARSIEKAFGGFQRPPL